MDEIRLRRLGIEKQKKMDENFDDFYQLYKDKAKKDGYDGDLKFVRSHGKVEIYVVI